MQDLELKCYQGVCYLYLSSDSSLLKVQTENSGFKNYNISPPEQAPCSRRGGLRGQPQRFHSCQPRAGTALTFGKLERWFLESVLVLFYTLHILSTLFCAFKQMTQNQLILLLLSYQMMKKCHMIEYKYNFDTQPP